MKTFAQIDKAYDEVARKQAAEHARHGNVTPAHDAAQGYLDASQFNENETEDERKARLKKKPPAAGKAFVAGLEERGVKVATSDNRWQRYAQSHDIPASKSVTSALTKDCPATIDSDFTLPVDNDDDLNLDGNNDTRLYYDEDREPFVPGPAEAVGSPIPAGPTSPVSQLGKVYDQAQPGPDGYPRPRAVTPGSRPVLSDAHAAASPGYQSPDLPSVPFRQPDSPAGFSKPVSAADVVSGQRPATPPANTGPRSDSTERYARKP